MHKKIITLLSIILSSGSLLTAQYIPAEITRLTINPETSQTRVYFTGTDHPDATMYFVMQMLDNEDAVAILSSNTPAINDINHEYDVILDIPEVNQGPVGLYIRPYQDINTPLTSITSEIRDSTLYVEADFNWCQNSVELSWNGYNRWKNNTLHYQVWMKINDEPDMVIAEVPEETTQYQIGNLNAANSYLFYVVASRANPAPTLEASSNGVVLDTLETFYPEYIHADYATIGEGNHPVMQFTQYPESDITSFGLLRSTQVNGVYDTLTILENNLSLIDYTDEEVDASVQAYYYKLTAINSCKRSILESENIAGTIHLSGSLDGTQASLNWTAYQEWSLGIADYELERSFGEGPFELLDKLSRLSYQDDLNEFSDQGQGSRVCYKITALETPGDPHVSFPAQSISNSYCIILPMGIEFRFDAFTPEGITNNDFGPYMRFVPTGFDFRIYNRNGNMVFRSEDPVNTPRWDGNLRNGSTAPQGVYRYTLQFEDEYGNREMLQGKLTLVR